MSEDEALSEPHLPDPSHSPGTVSSEEGILHPDQTDVEAGGKQGHHQVSWAVKWEIE